MDRKTHREIVSLLVPLLDTPEKQNAFVTAAFFGTSLTRQVNLGGAPRDVAVQLVSACLDYGTLDDDEPAIHALLEEMLARVGGNKQVRIQHILDQLAGDAPAKPDAPTAQATHLSTTTALDIDIITLMQYFYDAWGAGDWQRADQLIGHLQQRQDLPAYFKLARYQDLVHKKLEANVQQAEAASEYNVLRVMAEHESLENLWAALKAFWDRHPGYDPANLRRLGRDLQYDEIRAMLNRRSQEDVWDALLAFWDVFPNYDPANIADYIHRHDEGFVEAVRRIKAAYEYRHLKLDLSGLSLRAVPQEIRQLVDLQELNLAHNELTQFPDVVTDLPQLETLSLSDNGIAVVPESIGYMTNLKSLRLNINRIEALPRAIGAVTTLERLYLHHNPLSTLPSTITRLKRLEVLDLGNNRFNSLPGAVMRLPNLKWLFLNENRLTAFPAVLLEMPDLRWLFLHGNQLTDLPPEIHQMKRLKWLSLSNNQLQNLPRSLGALADLESLAVSNNPLSELPADVRQRGSSAILAWLRQQQPPEVRA